MVNRIMNNNFAQRIEINRFGPINNLNIEVKDFIVLIGPQASGKSTIAKAIYFFKSLNDDLVKYFIDSLEKNSFNKTPGTYAKIIRQKFLDYFGASTHLSGLYIKYYFSQNVWIEITLEPNNKYVNPKFSEYFLRELNKLVALAINFANKIVNRNPAFITSKDLFQKDSEKRKFISEIKTKINTLFSEDRELIFIPAGRSLLATLADQLQYINPRKLDFLMRSFVDRINLIRPIFNKPLSDIIKEKRLLTQNEIDFYKVRVAEEYITRILKGKYQYGSDGEKIYYESKNYVKLNFSSSGQQESLWILLLVFLLIVEQQNVFIVIEEPEAHLFPEAQKEIVSLIALLSNQKRSQVIITTHSPYILAAFNNLILAHKVGGVNENIVAPKINKLTWLDYEKVYAAIVKSGTITDILDDELKIIQSEHIDSASSIINEEFDFLYSMEPH